MKIRVICVEYFNGYYGYISYVGFVNEKECLRWSDEVAMRNCIDDFKMILDTAGVTYNLEINMEEIYNQSGDKYVKKY